MQFKGQLSLLSSAIFRNIFLIYRDFDRIGVNYKMATYNENSSILRANQTGSTGTEKSVSTVSRVTIHL